MPASIPDRAVNAAPPIPVAVVIIAVAVAFLSPENLISVVSTLGYIAPDANPRGMQSAITIDPSLIIAMIVVTTGIVITAAIRIFLACFEKIPTSTLDGIITAQNIESA